MPHSPFESVLQERRLGPLTRRRTTTVQVNVGKICNQACHHCHVDAGPKRTERMSAAEAARVIELIAASPDVNTLDITGGAPELNENFRLLVTNAKALGLHVIDRCNLTVLFEPGMEWLPEFLVANGLHLICSLPCYSAENVDSQRGDGVFEKSIRALQMLNELGYGNTGSGPVLDLAYNPLGSTLPPPQVALEKRYKDELMSRFGIRFDRLLTITNMPIKRFAQQLERKGALAEYMALLVNHFNADTVDALMCRSLVSVGHDGNLYDCDFNQMLALPLRRSNTPVTLRDIDSFGDLNETPVTTTGNCFGCTAGRGSSCSGALDDFSQASDPTAVSDPLHRAKTGTA